MQYARMWFQRATRTVQVATTERVALASVLDGVGGIKVIQINGRPEEKQHGSLSLIPSSRECTLLDDLRWCMMTAFCTAA